MLIDALKTLSVLCPTSSFFFSESYLTSSLCGETILFLFWIYLTFVIFVLDLFSLVYSLCAWVSLFFINEVLLLIKKKKTFLPFSLFFYFSSYWILWLVLFLKTKRKKKKKEVSIHNFLTKKKSGTFCFCFI